MTSNAATAAEKTRSDFWRTIRVPSGHGADLAGAEQLELDCEKHREDAQHLTTTLRQKGGRSLKPWVISLRRIDCASSRQNR
jgi:hypothetical protein